MMIGTRKDFVFQLDVVDDWPPVGAECLPFEKTRKGWKLLVPPLYVKKLSVGDVLQIKQRAGNVSSWKHVSKSGNTTVWLLSMKAGADKKVSALLDKLDALGCQTGALSKLSSYSVSVPANLPIARVDSVLAKRNESEIAVAFPSFRHDDEDPPARKPGKPHGKKPDVKPIKDSKQRPVPTAWRPLLHQIADAFLRGDYKLASVAGDVKVSRATAAWIKRSITEYPEKLVELSEKTWDSSVVMWMECYWQVLVDLWTATSGRSDLVLHAHVYEKPRGVRVVVDSVHVP